MAHILIVDDNPVCRLALRSSLERSGHRTSEARNGSEAIAANATLRPELVLLDVMMPEKDGIETLLQLRKADEQLPIVMISDGGLINFDHALETARLLGASASLRKPFSLIELNDVINRTLESPEANP